MGVVLAVLGVSVSIGDHISYWLYARSVVDKPFALVRFGHLCVGGDWRGLFAEV